MATAEVDIYNLALSEIGSKSSVALPSEKSREAELCRLWYSITVDAVLRAAPWPCATAYKRLGLLSTRDNEVVWVNTDPNPGWKYAYGCPADMLRPRYLTTFARFSLSTYDNTAAVMTNQEAALLAYTKRQEQVGLWDAQLQLAIVHALAANVAMGLQGKEARARRVADAANNLILQAREAAANEEEEQFETLPDWLSARGASTIAVDRFIYPQGPLLIANGVVGVE